jgi:hypothetical protein
MPPPELRWENQSPAPRGRLLPLVAATPGRPVCDQIVLGRVVGVLTHWHPRRGPRGTDIPHGADVEACEGCRLPQRPRWKGYLVLRREGRGTYYLVCMPSEAVRVCPMLLDPPGGTLVGRWLHLERASWRSGPVTARLSTPMPLAACRDWHAADVLDDLARRWGVLVADLVLADQPAPDHDRD